MYTNGRYQNDSPGLSERDPGLQGDPLDRNYQDFDDDEKNKTGEEVPRLRGKRGRLVGVVLFLLLLSFVGTGIWLMFGGNKTKINVPVRDDAQKSDQARSNDDVTAEAIAEARGATVSPPPALSASPVPATPAAGAGTIIVPTTPVTVPMEGVGGTVSPATDAATRDVGGV